MANYISSLVVDYKDTKQLKYGVNNICDNTTYYGSTTWSVIDDGGITGLAVDGLIHDGVILSSNDEKYLVITNRYTGTTFDPMIIVKASSDLVSCDSNNTCIIGIYRACWHQSFIFELVINDDSKNYITNITGYNYFRSGINSPSDMGYVGMIDIYYDKNNNNNYTSKEITIYGNCSAIISSGDKICLGFDNININISLSNNVQNVSVSGEVKYKFGDDTYTTLDSLSSDIYTYTSTSNSINITGCNYKTTQLHDLMDGFKTLYIKHIINLKYDDEVQEVQYKWYTSTDNGSTWSESIEFTITITVNNNFSGGEFVRVAYCTENRDDCADSYTIRNGNNITLDRTWELSDLRSSEINCAIFRTDSSLTTDLKNSSNGTYHISGDIVSSLGSNFPINVYYEVNEKEYKYYSNFNTIVVTEISKTFIVNEGYMYKPADNLVIPFVLVDDSDNMYTDTNDYTIGDYFGEVDLTKSCTIGTVSGGYPTHTRMAIAWNEEGTLPGWVTNRNGLDTDNTTATAGFYVTSHNTKLKVSFTCSWKSSNANKFTIQDLSWADVHYNFSDIFETISITCWQDTSSTNTHVTKYTTSKLDVKSIYISSSNYYTITGIDAKFKFKSPKSLPLDFITLINNNNVKIKMMFAYPVSQSPVYSNRINGTDLGTATYNINWTFNGITSLSVKFLIE